MTTLYAASRQWATRPSDERFVSLIDLQNAVEMAHANSREKVISSRGLQAVAVPEDKTHKALRVEGPNGVPVDLTHWSFSQLAQRAGAPAGYMRDLPAPLAADCLNYGLMTREVEDLGIMYTKPAGAERAVLRAVTGPQYGRIWNKDIVAALVRQFGDGINGQFRVPGEFGKRVEVTKANTTLFASDRDFFVFLADEENRIEVPNRRDGQAGSMARGFFVWNSEVGSASFGVQTFLFDYVCGNRIVWGASDVQKITIRHTASAPDKFIEEARPALLAYAKSSTKGITDGIAAARAARLEDKVDEFLKRRQFGFTNGQVSAIKAAHLSDEGRPIETVWDAVTGATAYARGIEYQDQRIEIERAAGKMMDSAL